MNKAFVRIPIRHSHRHVFHGAKKCWCNRSSGWRSAWSFNSFLDFIRSLISLIVPTYVVSPSLDIGMTFNFMGISLPDLCRPFHSLSRWMILGAWRSESLIYRACSSFWFIGTIKLRLCRIASSAEYPNINSAAGLYVSITPLPSIVIMSSAQWSKVYLNNWSFVLKSEDNQPPSSKKIYSLKKFRQSNLYSHATLYMRYAAMGFIL